MLCQHMCFVFFFCSVICGVYFHLFNVTHNVYMHVVVVVYIMYALVFNVTHTVIYNDS